MSLAHFFLESQIIAEEQDSVFELRLSADDAKHAHVLRLSAGEHIAVVDAASDYFECEVVSSDKDVLRVSVAQHLDAPERPSVVLVQGLAKGDKMDTIVRHATELDVAAFVPLICERSVVKLDAKKAAARKARWESIAKSAAMQSGRCSVPEISEPLSVCDAASILSGATAVLVCWEESPLTSGFGAAIQRSLAATGTTNPLDARIAVVVGSEGGLTSGEVQAFLDAGEYASAVTLGPSILRTETAGIVAPALALYELEGRA